MVLDWIEMFLAGAGTFFQMLWTWEILGTDSSLYFGPFIVATFVIGVIFRAVLYKA